MAPTPGELIERRSALSRGLIADRFADPAVAIRGLRRMRLLVNRLGDPQHAYPVIHIAGSKGKGTTTHIAAALLTAHGFRIGRYTSPHLHTWNERIAVDDTPIDDIQFGIALEHVDQTMTHLEDDLPDLGTFNAFELITAAAFVHFREIAVDCSVIEVGLGGRFDSTNVVHALVSVITRIEHEHADVLGPELQSIAWNKAGIVTSDAPVVVATQEPEVLDVVLDEAATTGAPILLEGRDWSVEQVGDMTTVRMGDVVLADLPAPLPGAHNLTNLGAAIQAVSIALSGRELDIESCRSALRKLRIPGRFERFSVGSPPVDWVLDVAHTRESIGALLDTAYQDPAFRSPALVLALMTDKPAEGILAALAGRIAQLILPAIPHSRLISPTVLAGISEDLGITTQLTSDIDTALAVAAASRRPVIVSGSFAIVGHVRAALIANQDRSCNHARVPAV